MDKNDYPTIKCVDTVYYVQCPDCGDHGATLTNRQLFTNSVPHEGYGATTECPSCGYHHYEFVGKDI